MARENEERQMTVGRGRAGGRGKGEGQSKKRDRMGRDGACCIEPIWEHGREQSWE